MSRYHTAHLSPQGENDARPTALQIIEDEGLLGKLNDKTFLVTGVSNGIGVETMRALYATGAHVFGTVRNMEKGQKVVEQILAETEGGKITLIEMDNESLASVRNGAEIFLKESKSLNALVLNAGVVGIPEGRTKDGFELQLGVNYIAHALLFQLLKDTLLASSSNEFPSRVVSVSSVGHRCSPIRFDDYNFVKEEYNPWLAYGQSKTATIYLANEIERRFGSKGLHATSLNPGLIFTKPQPQKGWEDPKMTALLKSAQQGAATTIYAALSEEWKYKGGKYLADCVEQGPTKHPENPMFIGDDGYEAWVYDEVAAQRLWTETLAMIGMETQS